MSGILVEHISYSPGGLRLFESRHKGHAETVGVRVLFTPWRGPAAAMLIFKRWISFLESACVGSRHPLWQLPTEDCDPPRADHSVWMRDAFTAAGVSIAFDLRVHPHLLRATSICHALALRISPPMVAARAGHATISSLDHYARPVFIGPTSRALFSFLHELCSG